MFSRAYIEITNVCNLSCPFCPGTKRPARFMSLDEFRIVAERLRPVTDYIYLHVMGEPLLHPELKAILEIAAELNFKINITTNGTLLAEKSDIILGASNIRKVSVSLHSFEGNFAYQDSCTISGHLTEYLDNIWSFCLHADCIIALRLWNGGGADTLNSAIMEYLSQKTGLDVPALPYDSNGRRLTPFAPGISESTKARIYLENADKFDWPSLSAKDTGSTFCHGLTSQIGVLCDGTVIPCCLDSEGTIALGNLFSEDIGDILNSPRACAMREGFASRRPSEELCRKCGYASRF